MIAEGSPSAPPQVGGSSCGRNQSAWVYKLNIHVLGHNRHLGNPQSHGTSPAWLLVLERIPLYLLFWKILERVAERNRSSLVQLSCIEKHNKQSCYWPRANCYLHFQECDFHENREKENKNKSAWQNVEHWDVSQRGLCALKFPFYFLGLGSAEFGEVEKC